MQILCCGKGPVRGGARKAGQCGREEASRSPRAQVCKEGAFLVTSATTRRGKGGHLWALRPDAVEQFRNTADHVPKYLVLP